MVDMDNKDHQNIKTWRTIRSCTTLHSHKLWFVFHNRIQFLDRNYSNHIIILSYYHIIILSYYRIIILTHHHILYYIIASSIPSSHLISLPPICSSSKLCSATDPHLKFTPAPTSYKRSLQTWSGNGTTQRGQNLTNRWKHNFQTIENK